jgi:hypothetical protein
MQRLPTSNPDHHPYELYKIYSMNTSQTGTKLNTKFNTHESSCKFTLDYDAI